MTPPNFHDGTLSQGQGFAALSKIVTLVADNQVVNPEVFGMIDLRSDSVTSTARTFTLMPSPLGAGHFLTLLFTSGSSTTCELADTGTMKLITNWVPVQYDTLTLMSDGTNWLEISRGTSTGQTALTLTSAHLFVGNGSNVATDTAVTGDVTIDNTGLTAIGAGKVTQAMVAVQTAAGLNVKRIAHGIFNPTAVSGDRTIAPHTLGATIPDKSFVSGAWYWVETTCTSATDAGTIALSIQAANDLTTATAISAGGDIWDTSAKPVECTPVIETTSTWLLTTAARAITATVAVEALTGGKIHVFVEYWTHS